MATTITSRVGGLPIASPAEVQQAKSYAEIARQHAESAESSADAAAESEAAAAASATSAANSALAAASSADDAAASAASAVEVTGALPRVNRSTLKALDTSQITIAYLTEVGREGMFRWRTGDFSAQVAVDTQEGVYIKADAVPVSSGIWERVSDGPVNVKWFGAVGDGVTDDTAAIQAAIDFAIYVRKDKVRLSGGVYKITDTLHCGYGENFHSVVLEGDGYSYRGETNFAGTAIDASGFSDRPAIAIQGARGTVVRALGLIGAFGDYYADNNFASSNGVPSGLDDTDPDDWHVEDGHANQDSRYAPYAAIAIDPYSGTRPATSYPDVSYPDYTGIETQYGKNFSSDVLIDDVFISGFTVGVVNQPCDADGNGDFTNLRRVNIERCKWGVSVGNTQARNTALSDVKMGRVYCALVTNVHGKQSGKFGSVVKDLSIGGAIKIFQFGSLAFAGPVTFVNCYTESLWTLGTINVSSSNEAPLEFIGCQFEFHLHDASLRGAPADVLGVGSLGEIHDGTAAPVTFRGTRFSNFLSVLPMYHGTSFDGCVAIQTSARDNADLYEKFAHNALAGGFVVGALARPAIRRLQFLRYNLETGATAGAISTAVQPGTRTHCISPLFAEKCRAASDASDEMPPPFFTARTEEKSSLSNVTLTDRLLTFSFSSRDDWEFMLLGPLPGDVIYDNNSGSIFFVSSRDELDIEAVLQNNFRPDGEGGFEPIVPFSTTTGTFYILNSRIYTPQYYLRGDLTASSSSIANCGRDDDFAAWFEAEIAAGDALFVNEFRDRFIGPNISIIAARDQSAGTITISGNAPRSQTLRRLDYFVRQPPANV